MGSKLVFGPLGLRPLLVVEELGQTWRVLGNDFPTAERGISWLGAVTGKPAAGALTVYPKPRSGREFSDVERQRIEPAAVSEDEPPQSL